MAKRKEPRVRVKLGAIAKAEASVKASFKHEKRVAEIVPPDVSRAKAGAWLDLISPITEWAGLKGDALRFKRRELRIQQEEVLFRVAELVRSKVAGRELAGPVPRKILVPALEKASLEDARDGMMIEMWSNLLASAATGAAVEPRYVGIIAELSGSQARCLSILAQNRAHEVTHAHSFYKSMRYQLSELEVRSEVEKLIEEYSDYVYGTKQNNDHFPKLLKWCQEFDGPGVHLEEFAWRDFEFNVRIGEGLSFFELDKQILETLGLIKTIEIHFDSKEQEWPGGFARYFYLTALGVDFISVCDPNMIAKLIELEEAQKAGRQ